MFKRCYLLQASSQLEAFRNADGDYIPVEGRYRALATHEFLEDRALPQPNNETYEGLHCFPSGCVPHKGKPTVEIVAHTFIAKESEYGKYVAFLRFWVPEPKPTGPERTYIPHGLGISSHYPVWSALFRVLKRVHSMLRAANYSRDCYSSIATYLRKVLATATVPPRGCEAVYDIDNSDLRLRVPHENSFDNVEGIREVVSAGLDAVNTLLSATICGVPLLFVAADANIGDLTPFVWAIPHLGYPLNLEYGDRASILALPDLFSLDSIGTATTGITRFAEKLLLEKCEWKKVPIENPNTKEFVENFMKIKSQFSTAYLSYDIGRGTFAVLGVAHWQRFSPDEPAVLSEGAAASLELSLLSWPQEEATKLKTAFDDFSSKVLPSSATEQTIQEACLVVRRTFLECMESWVYPRLTAFIVKQQRPFSIAFDRSVFSESPSLPGHNLLQCTMGALQNTTKNDVMVYTMHSTCYVPAFPVQVLRRYSSVDEMRDEAAASEGSVRAALCSAALATSTACGRYLTGLDLSLQPSMLRTAEWEMPRSAAVVEGSESKGEVKEADEAAEAAVAFMAALEANIKRWEPVVKEVLEGVTSPERGGPSLEACISVLAYANLLADYAQVVSSKTTGRDELRRAMKVYLEVINMAFNTSGKAGTIPGSRLRYSGYVDSNERDVALCCDLMEIKFQDEFMEFTSLLSEEKEGEGGEGAEALQKVLEVGRLRQAPMLLLAAEVAERVAGLYTSMQTFCPNTYVEDILGLGPMGERLMNLFQPPTSLGDETLRKYLESLEAAAKIERERQMLRGQKIAEDAVTLYQTPKYKNLGCDQRGAVWAFDVRSQYHEERLAQLLKLQPPIQTIPISKRYRVMENLNCKGDALALKCDAVVVSCDGSISTTGGFGRGLAAGLFKNGGTGMQRDLVHASRYLKSVGSSHVLAGGGRLPQDHVILTRAPGKNSYVEGLLTFASLGLRKKKRDFDGLATTYWNALEEVKMKSRDNSIRTIALSSLSTGVFDYPIYESTHVALATVRKWLETDSNAFYVDCIYFVIAPPKISKDKYPKLLAAYSDLLHLYFPRTGNKALPIPALEQSLNREAVSRLQCDVTSMSIRRALTPVPEPLTEEETKESAKDTPTSEPPAGAEAKVADEESDDRAAESKEEGEGVADKEAAEGGDEEEGQKEKKEGATEPKAKSQAEGDDAAHDVQDHSDIQVDTKAGGSEGGGKDDA